MALWMTLGLFSNRVWEIRPPSEAPHTRTFLTPAIPPPFT
jgi:hypothetical protein